MIAEIEKAVAAYLTARFAAMVPPCTAAVRAAMSEDEKPTAESVVVVKCANAGHVVGGMADPEMQITVESPLVSGVTMASHIAIERALRVAFPEDNGAVPEALVTAVEAHVPGKTCCGFFFKGQQPGIEQTGWVPYYEVALGIDPVP